MHIDTIPNRNSRPAYLLRESVRDGKHVRKRTLANLSSLPIELIDAKPARERALVVAMVAERMLAPEASKLGMTRAFTDTTLGEDLGVADADEDELYAAMDWLSERQEAIEKRLAKR